MPETSFPDLAVNANHFIFWQRKNSTFREIAALRAGSMPIGGGQTEQIGILQTTANLFSVLGFQPRLGRTFTAEEEQPGHDVVLLTDGLWKRQYAADPAIVGKTVTMDGKPYQVIGVLPPDFALPNPRAIGGINDSTKTVEAFIPFGWTAEVLDEIEGDHNYFAIGRLKPGVTVARALADLNVQEKLISRQIPDKMALAATVIPFQEYLVGSSRATLLMLLAAVSGILLIACINLTNLLLARATGRGHESALRQALGASQAQLLRHALMEPLLLTTFGCVLGLGLAAVGLPALLRFVPADLPRANEVHLDLPVLAFAVGISLLAGLACGLMPAWRLSKSAPQLALRDGNRTASESKAAKRLRQGLVVGEVAASVMLVLLAGLFISSMMRLLRIDRGFQSEHVLSAEIVLPDKQYGKPADRNAFYDRALARLRQLPGVESAGTISVLPLDGDNWGDMVSKVGDTRPLWEKPAAHYRWITPGFFETLRVPLIAGRFLTNADKGRNVAIISKQVADTVWPGQNAIGRIFQRADPNEPGFEVVGVVGNLRSVDLAQIPPRMVYVPYWYRSRESGSFVLRTTGDPAAMEATVRKALWSIDSQIAIPQIRTMAAVVDGSVSGRRFQMHLLLTFAVCSLLLAGLGIYGVVAYSAMQRTQEIGIRMALGANRGDVYRMILVEGVAPVLIGTLAGVGLASLGGRLIANLLFEVRPNDPLIAGISCLLLLAIGVAACLLPARRATAIEPIEALRYE
jgi:predicted permease